MLHSGHYDSIIITYYYVKALNHYHNQPNPNKNFNHGFKGVLMGK